jgi:hypothetical protein
MFGNNVPLDEYFKYHPPKNASRIEAHENINNAALEFARAVDINVSNPELKQFAFLLIMQARMFANQGITLDYLDNE